MIEAIVFDMDGLLVDSEPYWDKVRRDLASSVGRVWTEADHLAVMGTNSDEWSDYMIKRLGLKLSREEVKHEIVSGLAALYKKRIPFLPGAVEVVRLCSEHWQVGLASGSHPILIDLVTNDHRLSGCFDVIVSADEVTRGKPAPDIYLEVARRLQLHPQQCVCFEDSGNGIVAGHVAEMYVIAVPDRRYPLSQDHLSKADLVLQSLDDVTLDLLESLRRD